MIPIFRKKIKFLTNSTIAFFLITICLFTFINEIEALNVIASSRKYDDVLSAIKDFQSACGGTIILPKCIPDWWVDYIKLPSGINIFYTKISRTNLRIKVSQVFLVNRYDTNKNPCRISGISFDGNQAGTLHTAQVCLDVRSAQNPYTHRLNIASSKTYYVAQDGNDNNNGSELTPWLSIQKAANTAVAGDTVYIKEAVYHEQIILQKSGVSGNFITYKAYPNHKPIIDGQNSGTVFSIVGKEYIKLDSLEIKNAGQWGILVENSTNIEIKNTKVSYSNNGENIQIRGSSSFILIEGCETSHAWKWSGIDIYQYNGRPHHVTVKNCISHHNEKFAGIASEQVDNLIIVNNTCYNNSLGIDIGSGDNNIIKGNIVHDCATGIALSSNEDSQIYDNLIYNIFDEAIYSYYWIKHGEAHARNKWHNNIIHSAGFGIYESLRKNVNYDIGPSSDHEYYNNLFYNIGTHGKYRVPFYFQGVTRI